MAAGPGLAFGRGARVIALLEQKLRLWGRTGAWGLTTGVLWRLKRAPLAAVTHDGCPDMFYSHGLPSKPAVDSLTGLSGAACMGVDHPGSPVHAWASKSFSSAPAPSHFHHAGRRQPGSPLRHARRASEDGGL